MQLTTVYMMPTDLPALDICSLMYGNVADCVPACAEIIQHVWLLAAGRAVKRLAIGWGWAARSAVVVA